MNQQHCQRILAVRQEDSATEKQKRHPNKTIINNLIHMQEFSQTQLYSFGSNTWYQNLLGEKAGTEMVATPTAPVFSESIENDTIIDVALGAEYSLLLMKSGRCFVGGLSAYGQLGIYPNTQCSTSFVTKKFEYLHSLSHVNIVQISCGAEHSCFLTDTGRIYLCGYNYHKEITGSQNNVYHPLEIHTSEIFGSEENERVVEIVAGSWHTAFLTNAGNVYSRGRHLEYEVNATEYVKLNGNFIVKKLKCGEYFTLMLDTEDNLWLLSTFSTPDKWRKVAMPGKALSFACKDKYFVVTNEASKVTLFNRDGSPMPHGSGKASDMDEIPDNLPVLDVALTVSYTALIYPRGYLKFLYNNPSDERILQVHNWVKNVSLPKCSYPGANLKVATGYNHFMLYWTSESKSLQLFWKNLLKLTAEEYFKLTDIDIQTQH